MSSLTVDLSDGPNPIMTALLKRERPGGHVRELYGLGYLGAASEWARRIEEDKRRMEAAALLPAIDIVHDPVPAETWFEPAARVTTSTILQGLVSATPTGSINLKLRRA